MLPPKEEMDMGMTNIKNMIKVEKAIKKLFTFVNVARLPINDPYGPNQEETSE